MKPTAEFYAEAEARIMRVLLAYKPKLLAAYGTVDPEIKDDATPVTQLDKELETLLRDELQQFDPAIGLEGEEHGKQGNNDTFWLIDPIDGTESFVRGLPFVRNMITLIDGGEPVFALIYKPISDELYTAHAGGGTLMNGQPQRVSNRPLSRAWIELSVPLQETSVFPLVQAVRNVTNGYRTYGDFTYVASGKVDGLLVYKSGGGPWDYAPRALLVREAGGRVANLGSTTYDYRNSNMLATNPVIFDDLMNVISATLA